MLLAACAMIYEFAPHRSDEQRDQSEHEAIERGEIRRALSGTVGDSQLMFEQQ